MRFARRLRLSMLALLLASPMLLPAAPAFAMQSREELEDLYREADGRLRGYETNAVVMPESSVALTYFAFIGLTILAAGVMFKTAKRTHLD